MTTLARLAAVAASFLAFPAAVVFLGPPFGMAQSTVVPFALYTIPASGVIAICVAASFHKADRAKAGVR